MKNIKINIPVRFKNPMFVAQLLLSILLPILTYFGLEAKDVTTWNKLGELILSAISNPYVLALIVISIWNAVNDPTVEGFSDSKRALGYLEPSKNANKE